MAEVRWTDYVNPSCMMGVGIAILGVYLYLRTGVSNVFIGTVFFISFGFFVMGRLEALAARDMRDLEERVDKIGRDDG